VLSVVAVFLYLPASVAQKLDARLPQLIDRARQVIDCEADNRAGFEVTLARVGQAEDSTRRPSGSSKTQNSGSVCTSFRRSTCS